MVSEPYLYLLTQLLTWGQSDLRDFAIIYMNNFEAFIYFMINTITMSFMWIPAMLWMCFTFWIYGLQIAWKSVRYLLNDDGPRRGRGGRGRRGHRDDSDDDDDHDDDNDQAPTS